MGDFTEATNAINTELACESCGAILKFKPGTKHLKCEYCGGEQDIAQPEAEGEVQEISLEDFLARNFEAEEKMEVAAVKCESCGATSTLAPNISSDKCPFCASNLVIKSGSTATIHKPQYVLPFGVNDKQAIQNFRTWLNGLWFAPNDLTKYGQQTDKLNGMYLPFWTFDCDTRTSYTGQRGEDYYVTENYTTTENGQSVTRSRQVRRTRWYPAAGNVANMFDDILIEATRSLPQNKLRELEPWDLKNLTPYNDKFLSGFRTETYVVDVKNGYGQAKQRMEPIITDSIHRDIGGDRQIVHYSSTTYKNPTFKHILLPVWLSAYRYNNKVYQFIINARTGEVQGDRPYSAIKIALAVITGIIVIILLAMVFGGKQ